MPPIIPTITKFYLDYIRSLPRTEKLWARPIRSGEKRLSLSKRASFSGKLKRMFLPRDRIKILSPIFHFKSLSACQIPESSTSKIKKRLLPKQPLPQPCPVSVGTPLCSSTRVYSQKLVFASMNEYVYAKQQRVSPWGPPHSLFAIF